LTTTSPAPFAERLVRWQHAHGRHDLPWQTRDAYRIWLSEIMLQQTQVATVIPYYQRFVASYPQVADLAAAPLDDVLAHWAGLGYYSRARNLHAAARMVMAEFGGVFPTAPEALLRLPGIGRSPAAAIAAFAVGEPVAILDGNVKRVLTRWAGIEGFPGEKAVEKQLWELAQGLLPAPSAQLAGDMQSYTQGMMDLGTTLCTRSKPQCPRCPLREDCRAYAQGRTASLPTRKPAKQIPERSAQMLLLFKDGQLLLEKRPPVGIWGGLWSLPELAPGVDAVSHSLARWNMRVSLDAILPPLVHTFTHFRLTITPIKLSLTSAAADAVADTDLRWFAAREALAAGIPTPVRKLILLAARSEERDR